MGWLIVVVAVRSGCGELLYVVRQALSKELAIIIVYSAIDVEN